MASKLLINLLIRQAEAKAQYELLSEIIAEVSEKETKSDPTTALGHAIKTARINIGLTQPELGEMVGYQKGATTSISRVESGLSIPRPVKLRKIAEVLGLDFEALFALTSKDDEDLDT